MDFWRAARLAITMAFCALIAWGTALYVGLASSSLVAVLILRTILSLGILILLTRFWVRRSYASPGLLGSVLSASVVAFAISPTTWSGRTLIGQQFVDPGPLTVVIDLVLWVGAVALAASTASSLPAEERYQGYAGPAPTPTAPSGSIPPPPQAPLPPSPHRRSGSEDRVQGPTD